MEYKIAIVDDEQESIDSLRQCLDLYANEYGVSFDTDLFTDGANFLSGYKPGYDVVFMDVDMPKLNGLLAAKSLRSFDDNVVLVFITNLAKYAIKGYEVNARDYILKPLNYSAFKLKIKRILSAVKIKQDKNILLTSNGTTVKVDENSIYYIEINNHNIVYHTEKGDFTSYGTMKLVEKTLSKNQFFRCNSGYLVNLKHISKVAGNEVIIVNGDRLVISRARKKEFLERIHKFYMGEND